MSWHRLDDQFDDNDKQLALSDAAFRLWVCSWSFCARRRPVTGCMTDAQALALARKLGKTPKHIAELVTTGRWERTDDGYAIHDFSEYVEKGSRERVAKHRATKGKGPSPSPGNGLAILRERQSNVTSPLPGGYGDATSRATGLPVPEPVPVTKSPPTSDSPPQPPRGAGESGDMQTEYLDFLAELSMATGVQWREDGLSRTLYRAKRLEGFSAEYLRFAAKGVALDPWFMGRNGDGIPRFDPHTVLKSPKLQTFHALGRGEIVPRPVPLGRDGPVRDAGEARMIELLSAADDAPPQPALRALSGGMR